jgi:hypothetical protein
MGNLKAVTLPAHAIDGVSQDFSRELYWGPGFSPVDPTGLYGTTFGRASVSAAFEDAAGDLATYAIGERAQVYRDGLLLGTALFGAVTNRVEDSEDFTTANWNDGAAPSEIVGSRYGIQFSSLTNQNDGTFNNAITSSAYAVAAGETVYVSGYTYAGTSTETAIRLSGGGVNRAIVISWASGVPSITSNPGSVGFLDFNRTLELVATDGDGTKIYRVGFAVTNNTGGTLDLVVQIYAAWSVNQSIGTVAYWGGIQLSDGGRFSPYVKTTTAPVTTFPDDLTTGEIETQSLPTDAVYALFLVDLGAAYDEDRTIACISDGTASNFIVVKATASGISVTGKNGGVDLAIANEATTDRAGETWIAAKAKPNGDLWIKVDGVEISQGNNGTACPADLSQIDLAKMVSGSDYGNLIFADAKYFRTEAEFDTDAASWEP